MIELGVRRALLLSLLARPMTAGELLDLIVRALDRPDVVDRIADLDVRDGWASLPTIRAVADLGVAGIERELRSLRSISRVDCVELDGERLWTPRLGPLEAA